MENKLSPGPGEWKCILPTAAIWTALRAGVSRHCFKDDTYPHRKNSSGVLQRNYLKIFLNWVVRKFNWWVGESR